MTNPIPRARIWWRRLWIPAAVLLAVALAFWWMRTPAIDVDIGVVDRGPVRVTVDEVGTTRVRDHVDVHAAVTGRWVPRVHEAGDTLRRGDVLGLMYPAPLDGSMRAQAEARIVAASAAVREAEARVEQARTMRAEAVRTRGRMEQVGAAGGVSTEAVERARDAAVSADDTYRAALARRDALQADRDAARAVLRVDRSGALVVRAPQDGTLLEWRELHERLIPAGTPLARLGDVGSIEVLVPLLTTDAARVRIGASALVRFGGDGTAEGTAIVHRIEPTAFPKVSALGVEEQRVQVILRVQHEAQRTLTIGDQYRISARIVVAETPSALRVPVSALVHDGASWYVWTVEAGRTHRRTIRIGLRNAEYAEVRDGLEAQTRVVRYPGETIREDGRVRTSSVATEQPAREVP